MACDAEDEIYLRYPYDVSAILLWFVPRYKDEAMIWPAMPKMVCPEIYLRYPYDVSAILLWIVPRYKDKAMIRPAMPRWTMPLRFTWDNPMICRWGDTAMICPEMKTTICLRYYQYLPWNPCMACDAKMVFNWDLPVYMRYPYMPVIQLWYVPR